MWKTKRLGRDKYVPTMEKKRFTMQFARYICEQDAPKSFDKVQKCFRARGKNENAAPFYWLSGKLYCGEYGDTIQSVSYMSQTRHTYITTTLQRISYHLP